jgi:DNA-directed RNA polymerase specialized sigma24 family protein
LNEQAAAEIVGGASANEIDYREWRESVYEIALQQLLADESIHERTKQVFVRLAIDGEKPEAVAESLGIPYNTVIRIRKRAIARLRSYVEAMKKA